MPRGLAALAVVVTMAVGTWLGGWWVVPVAAMAWGWFVPGLRPWRIGLLAACAWAGLLALQASTPAFPALLGRLSGIFRLPPALLPALPPLFAGLLAWAAAGVVGRQPSALSRQPDP
jgi:hypothetical protein